MKVLNVLLPYGLQHISQLFNGKSYKGKTYQTKDIINIFEVYNLL